MNIRLRHCCFLLWAVLLLAMRSPTQSRTHYAPPTLVITGATLIDGTGGPPVPDSVVIIGEDRILTAGARSQFPIPKHVRVIDARGKWIIPGLIDAHVHFFQSGGLYTRPDVIDLRSRVPYEKELAWIRHRLTYTFSRYLCSGITSVVDVGGPMWNFKVREIAARTPAAPRVAVAGPLISTYAPKALETEDPAILRVDTPEQARAWVREELARKPDLIKIWFIRRPDSKLEDLVPIVEAAIEESHSHSVRVAVHATELETAKAAVRAGADILVHSVGDQPVDDEFVQMVKSREVIYTTTAVVIEGYHNVLTQQVSLTDIDRACGDPAVIATWSDLGKLPKNEVPPVPPRLAQIDDRMKNILANLKRMQDAGVVIAAGTDAGNIGTLHGSSLHREFGLMAEAGLTPMQIVVAATRNAAQVFAREPEMGTIEPNKLADLVILNADPLADVRNARKIYRVIKNGRVFDPSGLPGPPKEIP